MFGPLDVQVLVNRTLDIQKIQGAALRQPEEENKLLKERRFQEIEEEERQVRRRGQIVEGRVDDRERGTNRRRQEGEKRRSAQKKAGNVSSADGSSQSKSVYLDPKGRIIDIEV